MLCSSVLEKMNQTYWMSGISESISHFVLHLGRADLSTEILWNQWEVGSWISSVLSCKTKNGCFMSFSVCFLPLWANKTGNTQSAVACKLLIKWIQDFPFEFIYKFHDINDLFDHLLLISVLHTLGILLYSSFFFIKFSTTLFYIIV